MVQAGDRIGVDQMFRCTGDVFNVGRRNDAIGEYLRRSACFKSLDYFVKRSAAPPPAARRTEEAFHAKDKAARGVERQPVTEQLAQPVRTTG